MAGKPSAYWHAYEPFLLQVVAHAGLPVDWLIVSQAMPPRPDRGKPPTMNACRMKYQELSRQGIAPPPADLPVPSALAALPPPPDPLVLERDRQERVRRLKEERELLHDVAGEQSLRAVLEKLFRELAPRTPPPPPYRVPKGQPDTVEETMVLQLSDWHAYEVVSAERTRGLGVYNAYIFGQRVRRIV